MGRFSQLIKKSIKSRTLTYDITSYLFCKMGYGDINLAGQNARYKAYNRLKRKYEKYIGTADFKKYAGDEKPRVWVCWLQGFENAPELVKNCVKSMQYHIRDMEIVFLDKDNIRQYITLPEYIYEKWESGIIPNAQFSDLVRNQLIIEHGGLWIDSTTYLTGSIPNYITDSDFFVYHDGFFDCEVINMGNWLIWGKANNLLLNEDQNLLLTYWKDNNYLKQYFIMQLFFRMVSEHYPDEWEKVPYYSQMNQHTFMMELNNTFNKNRWKQLKEITPIHKLSNKIDFSNNNRPYCSMLDKLYMENTDERNSK